MKISFGISPRYEILGPWMLLCGPGDTAAQCVFGYDRLEAGPSASVKLPSMHFAICQRGAGIAWNLMDVANGQQTWPFC